MLHLKEVHDGEELSCMALDGLGERLITGARDGTTMVNLINVLFFNLTLRDVFSKFLQKNIGYTRVYMFSSIKDNVFWRKNFVKCRSSFSHFR